MKENTSQTLIMVDNVSSNNTMQKHDNVAITHTPYLYKDNNKYSVLESEI